MICSLILVFYQALRRLHICFYHLLDKSIEIDLPLPSKHFFCLCGATKEETELKITVSHMSGAVRRKEINGRRDALDFCRAEISCIHLNDDLSGLCIHTFFVYAVPSPP
jgi:hypothetical protein